METTRKITLPSGATCKVRRLTPRDSIKVGVIPDVLADPEKRKDTKAEREAKALYSVRMNEVILCECVSPITDKDGNVFRVVNKDAWSCSDNEQNCDLFATTEDGECIVNAVLELSGFGKSDKEALAPFPEEQSPTGEPGQDLPKVSESAVGSP